ncbi:SGNH/GDSL hydrolase family protein [Neobacillus drentensis]|uniref:SGNH/GDSL hydrolase family protein n=1 Tax=Neobacillus drentensis TaxID=220684 RepID=UPI001F2AB21E|nr:SGNH/GDSL hydrolase family protein [Neobacillus drentensis]ULT56183.1 SGNH/GDSL hydrolase family protein [Neobacillus drentensis]
MLKQSDVLLFIGDSITESGRFEDAEEIGFGYVRLIRDYLAINLPNQLPRVVNKGISGNHITDLVTRWDRDVIGINPDFVSISIGINDVWRRLDHPEKELVFPDRYEGIYRNLLNEVKMKTKAKLILMEPSIHGEVVESPGNKMLIPYVEVVRKLAKEYNAILVETHQVFIDYLNQDSPQRLTSDGVHMNSIGNMLMAKAWIKSFKNAHLK